MFSMLTAGRTGDDRARFPVMVLARRKLRQNIDEFAHAAGCQRLAGVHQRLVIGKPCVRLGQFVRRRLGSYDLGDGHIVDGADRLDNVVSRDASHASHPKSKLAPPHPPEAGEVATPQRFTVNRGGICCIIQSSIAASTATAMPTTTWIVMALVVPWKPSTQGETRTHNPTIRFSHSSQTANAARAAIASTAMTMPAMWAFEHPGREEQERAEDQVGDVAPFRVRPIIHDTLHMAPSVEGFLHNQPENRRAGSPAAMNFNETASAAVGWQ